MTYEPGQYQEVKPEDYKAEKTQDNSHLSSRKVITYKAVIKYGTVEKEVLVNKIDRTYEKDSKLSEYSDKYHKKTLVEGSPFDKIWGVGIADNDDRILNEANWRGKNLLGKALEEVRDFYR